MFKFKEVSRWYTEPEPYLCGLVALILGVILWGAWIFLSPAFQDLKHLNQEHQKLVALVRAEPNKPDKASPNQPPDFLKFLLVTDQTSDFLQAFSKWAESHQVMVEQLTSIAGTEGLNFELKAQGSFKQVFDFLSKFNEIPLLISHVKLKIIWPEIHSKASSNFLQLELSGLIYRSNQGKFNWNFQPYLWGNKPFSCEDVWRYQGWLRLIKPAANLSEVNPAANWVYRESSCRHEWVSLNDKNIRSGAA